LSNIVNVKVFAVTEIACVNSHSIRGLDYTARTGDAVHRCQLHAVHHVRR
jgi:hypothetical protein